MTDNVVQRGRADGQAYYRGFTGEIACPVDGCVAKAHKMAQAIFPGLDWRIRAAYAAGFIEGFWEVYGLEETDTHTWSI